MSILRAAQWDLCDLLLLPLRCWGRRRLIYYGYQTQQCQFGLRRDGLELPWFRLNVVFVVGSYRPERVAG